MFASLLAPFKGDPALVDAAVHASLDRLGAAWSCHGARPDLVAAAVRFAVVAHRGQRRESGELYASHPLAVAAIVASWGFDEVSVAAACCHDVLEDCKVSTLALAAAIGPEAASVVDGVTKVGRLNLGPGESASSTSMTKFLAAVVSDVRVLAVKLADRLHNLRTASAIGEERRLRSATEALEVFAPLAHRLGLEEPRREMEDLAFAIKMPDRYQSLADALESSAPDRNRIEDSALRRIGELLAAAGLRAEVESRTKHAYSIYQKQQSTGLAPEEMHDLIGVRVVLADREECYMALGVVHANFTPVPGRFKDFIALPRPSGYQSLHTTVLHDGFEVEVQIRSEEMHAQARYGVAAHYLYKNTNRGKVSVDPDLALDLATAATPEAFLERLREELAPSNEVVVLTPKGHPVSLPRESTVLDFAYKIHTDVGHRCVGAKINGSLVPIRSTLRTGDVIEVLTGSRASPSRDWLQVVRTSRAREKIRKFLEDAAHDPVAEGRSEIIEEIRHRSYGHLAEDAVYLARLATMNGFTDLAALCRAVAAGEVDPASLRGMPDRPPPQKTTASQVSNFEAQVERALGGLPCSFPRCCTPRTLVHVTGLVSRMYDVSVHASDCTSLAATVRDLPPGEFARLLSVVEDDSLSWLEVRGRDRIGLLRDVLDVLVSHGADIAWSSVSNLDGVAFRFRFTNRVPNRAELLLELRHLDGVFDLSGV
jgi:GTP pyrophosphokinase